MNPSASDGLGAGSRRPPPLKFTWLALCTLATQAFVIAFVPDPVIRVALPCTLVVIAPFVVANWQYLGLRIAAGGLLLNLIVILTNGGLMPVDRATVDAVGKVNLASVSSGDHIPHSKNVLLENEEANLSILADNIVISLPGPHTRAVSPGDIMLALGLTLAGVELISASHRRDYTLGTC